LKNKKLNDYSFIDSRSFYFFDNGILQGGLRIISKIKKMNKTKVKESDLELPFQLKKIHSDKEHRKKGLFQRQWMQLRKLQELYPKATYLISIFFSNINFLEVISKLLYYFPLADAEALHLSGKNIQQQVQGAYSFTSSEKLEADR
jgi:hypothetical protein